MRILIVLILACAILIAGCAQQNTNNAQNTQQSAGDAQNAAPSAGTSSGLTKINVSETSQNKTSLDISEQPIVYFFYLKTCSYSQAQMRDVNPKLKSEFPQMVWEEYEVSSPAVRMKWNEMMRARNATPTGVPVTIVGQDVIVGYYPGETETKLRAAIKAEIARTEKKN